MGRKKPLLALLRELGIVPRSYSPPPRVPPSAPPEYVPCKRCGPMVRVTIRGTLYRHRPDPAVRVFCDYRYERYRYGWRRPGTRPDLRFPNAASAAYLLELLELQRKRST